MSEKEKLYVVRFEVSILASDAKLAVEGALSVVSQKNVTSIEQQDRDKPNERA